MKLAMILEWAAQRFTINGDQVTVLCNPSVEQVENLKWAVRWLYDPADGNYYVWPAGAAIHYQVAMTLGIDTRQESKSVYGSLTPKMLGVLLRGQWDPSKRSRIEHDIRVFRTAKRKAAQLHTAEA